MSKQTIADTLTGIAQLLDLKGENPFKIRAYVAGARAVEMYSGDLEAAVRNGELGQIEGIGDALAKKITELVTTGRLQYYEDLKAGFPPTIFELFGISGLGAKKIKALYEQLGVASIAQLDAACREERVAKLPGFGEKTARNLLAAVAQRMRSADFHRLGDVAGPTLTLAEELRTHPAVLRASEAGSFRRRKEIVRDLDFVASTNDPAAVAEFFVTRPEVAEVIARGPTKVSVRLQSGIQCDLRLVTDTEYPYALHHFTGSKEHNIELRQRALERGWSINEYRFSAAPDAAGAGEPLPIIRNAPEFYRALGLDYIPPELREGAG